MSHTIHTTFSKPKTHKDIEDAFKSFRGTKITYDGKENFDTFVCLSYQNAASKPTNRSHIKRTVYLHKALGNDLLSENCAYTSQTYSSMSEHMNMNNLFVWDSKNGQRVGEPKLTPFYAALYEHLCKELGATIELTY